MTDPLAPIADKLKRFIRLLSSDNDHEALGAARALNRTLKAAKLDIHALADNIGHANGKKFTEADAVEIYRRGMAEGKREAESELHGDEDFHNIDGSPSWHAMARFCQLRSDRLKTRESEFINSVAARTVYREPTEKQQKWLKAIFFRLGGRLT